MKHDTILLFSSYASVHVGCCLTVSYPSGSWKVDILFCSVTAFLRAPPIFLTASFLNALLLLQLSGQ